jgi:hypothetical protein
MKPLVVLDEAGNTGQDLTNRDQPVFVQSSVMLNNIDTEKLLNILVPEGNTEAHFKVLKRSSPGRKKILEAFESGLITIDNAKLSYIHKRFMVISKAVDLLIEPIMHEDGVDLYEQGGNIALSNMHYYCMPAFCGEKNTSIFYSFFVEMIREKTNKSYMDFYGHIQSMIKNCNNKDYRNYLMIFYITCNNIKYVLSTADIVSLDPAIPLFVQHCAEWGKRLNKRFDIIHDESKPIANKAQLLSYLMAEDEKDVIVGYDRRKWGLPLKATGINFADSKVVKQIQIADILAGAGAYWANGYIDLEKQKDKFWKALNRISIEKYVFNSVWPSTDMTAEELGTTEIGGINGADYVSELLIRQKTKREMNDRTHR